MSSPESGPLVLCSPRDLASLRDPLAVFGVRAVACDAVDEIPTDPCVLVARSPEAAIDLKALGGTVLQLTGDDRAVAAAAVAALLRRMEEQHRSLAMYEAGLLEQIVSLRGQVEHQRHLLADLRQAISVQPVALTAVVEPDGSTPGSEADFLIPMAIWGLSKIDLHFTPTSESGTLTVRMIVAETGATAGTWQMPYSLVAPGWNAFGFPAPLDVPQYGLRLVIEWSETGPALSMSGAIALPHGEAYVGTPVEQVRLPAMRIYRGPAGATPVEVPYWVASPAPEGEL